MGLGAAKIKYVSKLMKQVALFCSMINYIFATTLPGPSSFCHVWKDLAGKQCESCHSNRYLYNDQCVVHCPPGFIEHASRVGHAYRNSIGGVCKKVVRATVAVWGQREFGGSAPRWLRKDGARAIYPNLNGFTIVYHDSQVVSWWGSTQVYSSYFEGVRQVFATKFSFAVIYSDSGNVSTWGLQEGVEKPEPLDNVQTIFSNEGAFVAVTHGHIAISWGSYDFGGCMNLNVSNTSVKSGQNSSNHTLSPSNRTCLSTTLTNVHTVFATERAFAALRVDGTVVSWGNATYGGCNDGFDTNEYACKPSNLRNVSTIFHTRSSFAALKLDGTVAVWGKKHTGGCNKVAQNESTRLFTCLPGSLQGVRTIFNYGYGFVAMHYDGTVTRWGRSSVNVDTQNNLHLLGNNVKSLINSGSGDDFVALRYNGTCYVWGSRFDARTRAIAARARGIIQVLTTQHAIYTLNSSGIVSVWPNTKFYEMPGLSLSWFRISKMYATRDACVGVGDANISIFSPPSDQLSGKLFAWGNLFPPEASLSNVYDVFASRNAFASMIDKCPLGQYKTEKHGLICRPCIGGKYSSIRSIYQCLDCPLGRHSSESGRSINCDVCSSGTYQDEFGQTRCKVCPVGRYLEDRDGTMPSLHASFENCTACSRGKYLPVHGAGFSENCIVCPPGRYAPDPGQQTCTKCPIGKYLSPSSGNADHHDNKEDCAACIRGKYTQYEGQEECFECPPGKWGGMIGVAVDEHSVCISCRGGTFQDEHGKESCKACPKGEYTSATGSVACSKCEIGRYGTSTLQTECKLCKQGMYQDGRGKIACKHCPANTFNPNKGAYKIEACTVCHTGRVTLSSVGVNSSSGCVCAMGYVREKGHCVACPRVGALCSEVNAAIHQIYTMPGFWRSSKGSLTFSKCSFPSFCRGGYSNVSINHQCIDGHGGSQCSTCIAPYIPVQNGCRRCQSSNIIGSIIWCLFLFLLLSAVFVTCFSPICRNSRRVLYSPSLSDDAQSRWLLLSAACCDLVSDLVVQGRVLPENSIEEFIDDKQTLKVEERLKSRYTKCLTRVTILVDFFQLTSIIGYIYRVPWPNVYVNFVNVLEWSNLYFPRSSCNVSVVTGMFLHIMLLPLAGIVAVLISWRLAVSIWPHTSNKNRSAYCACSMCLSWLNFLYPGLCSSVFRIFVCSNVDGDFYWSEDSSIKCWEGQHLLASLFAICLFIVYVIGLPIFNARLLYLLRQRCIRFDETSTTLCGSLYLPYKTKYYYTSILTMAKKFCLAGFFLLLARQKVVQLLFGLLFALLIFVFFLDAAPYEEWTDNRIHSLSMAHIIVTFLFALVFALDRQKVLDHSIMGTLLIVMHVCVTFVLLGSIISVLKEVAPKIERVCQILSEHFCCTCFSNCVHLVCKTSSAILRRCGIFATRGGKAVEADESHSATPSNEIIEVEEEEDADVQVDAVPETTIDETRSMYVVSVANEIAVGAISEAKLRRDMHDQDRRKKRLRAKDQAEGFEDGFPTEFWSWWRKLSNEERVAANETGNVLCTRPL